MSFSQGNSISVPGLTASTAIIQYSVVKFNSTTVTKVLAVTATSDIGFGICQNDPATDEPANVVVLGIAKAIASTSDVTAGDTLGFSTAGRVTDTTTDTTPIVGIALQTAAAAGDIIRVLVRSADEF